MAWGAGQLLFAGFEGVEPPLDLLRLIEAGRLGGIVLFARNVVDAGQLRRMTDRLHAAAPADAPLTLSIDQEGGRVQRLRAPWTEWPTCRALGEHDDPADTARVARALARELADLRVDLDFAPVVDVDTNPANPVIGDRSFAHEPVAVARHAVAFLEAMQAGGVAACAKHFPGHGDTALDSLVALPRVDHDLTRLREVELPPFRAAAEAGVASMMTAHVLLPCLDPHLPATLCESALALLRDEIGYDGLIFGDDLEMAAVAEHFEPRLLARRAIEAGVDALLVCRQADLREVVLSELEALPEAQLEPALRRMEVFKRRYAGGGRASGATPPYPEHVALAERLGSASHTPT